ncbi:zinc-dependent metalloprotease [Polluticoccus soli]|uniref:zinc-dependent metalloprotease n=1 Tax=Polluticoccus soli TaxID=3034150 RepID=UPI0023E24A47|nr:zinc-dependent metalloprotease [Flavipsychrobacter sp. JY13-12]
MIRKFTLLFLACVASVSLSKAQPVCGFDKVHKERMQTNPEYAAAVNQFNVSAAAWLAQQQANPQALVTTFGGNKAWEIPVVVHVVHTGQAIGTQKNPSIATIQNFVNYLSQAFTASYSGHLLETNGGTRIPIVFKLAARTPNCGPTNGIERIDLSSNSAYNADGVGSPGLSDAAMKATVPGWPSTEYYNIWIVTEIDGKDGSSGVFTAGYAYFPQTTAFAVDGTVVLAASVNVGNSVITHELGHAFNLYHVFEGGTTTTCPPAPDDFVADTEPQRQSNFDCPSLQVPVPINPCTGVQYGNGPRNFMDYSNCKDRFTPGQRVRVWDALQNLTAIAGQPTTRSSLISSLGATPLGATVAAAFCNPTGNGTNSSQGLRAVTIVKQTTSQPDTLLMNAISGSVTEDGNLNYFDRTCQHRVELIGGTTYQFRARVGFTNENVRAWIDYNNNGSFTDPGELIYAPPAGNGQRPFGVGGFTVPTTAVSCIPLRMRVATMASPATPTACINLGNGQAEDYEVIIRGAGGGGGIVPGLVDVTLAPGIGNPSCDSTYMKLIAKPVGSTLPLWYQWFKKTPGAPPTVTAGPSVAPVNDTSSWTSTGAGGLYPDWTFRDKDTIWVRMAFPGNCGVDTTTDSFVIYRPDFVAPSVGIGIVGGVNPTCVDEVVTLGITSQSNTGGASFQWFRNGNPIPGANSATYNVLNQGNGDSYYLQVTLTPVNCNNFTTTLSTTPITINHTTKTPTASIALTVGTNPGCAGQVLTYTAGGTVLGTSPSYQWRVNSINVPGANASTFSSTFNNGDVVSVVITSSSLCAAIPTATATAPAIQQQLKTADITITQVSGGNPACSGHPVVFSATPVNSGPPAPQFQWLINNSPVIGANSPVFNTTSLLNGDVVKCVLISTDPCVVNTLDTSAPIQMNVTPSKVPKITFTITKGNNPGCLDSLVEFTATVTDAGTNPQIEWLVNGFPLNLNNPVYSTTNLLNNDVVIARIVPTDGDCYLPDTGYSAPLTMVRSITPNPPIISLLHNMLVTNINGSFVWFGPGGQLTGGEDGKYHPGELGQYYAVTNNNGCWSKPSNILTITLMDINDVNMQAANIYPNPTTGKLTVDWGRHVNMTVGIYSTVGQKLMEEKASNVSSKVIDLASLASGMYFVVVTDENGRSSTTRITLQR